MARTKRVQEPSKRPTTFSHGGKSTSTRKLTLLTSKWGIRDDNRRRSECMFDMTWAPKARLVEIFTCLQEMKRGSYYVNQCMVAQWGSLVHRGMIFFPCVKSRFSTTQVSLNASLFRGSWTFQCWPIKLEVTEVNWNANSYRIKCHPWFVEANAWENHLSKGLRRV